MRWRLLVAAAVAAASLGVEAQAASRTFGFTAQGITPAGGPEQVAGSVTVGVDLGSPARSGPVEAISLTIGETVYTPANTGYQYDPQTDHVSVQGHAERQASFDLEIRKASTASPGPADLSFTAAGGGYYEAASTGLTVR